MVRWKICAGIDYVGNGPPDAEDLAMYVLLNELKKNLQGGINIGFFNVVKAKDAGPVGYRFTERLETPFLLAAIYYDLWEMIAQQRKVEHCLYCGDVIEKHGPGAFCPGGPCKAKYHLRNPENKIQTLLNSGMTPEEILRDKPTKEAEKILRKVLRQQEKQK